eukprot:COSAG02_NODE_74724_length_154_cov_182.109091_1_plen_21_part_01
MAAMVELLLVQRLHHRQRLRP